MTEKQKIFMAIGIAGVLWIAIIIGVVAHFVADDFTLEDLKNLRKQVEKQAEGVEECVPDCLMQQSEIDYYLWVSMDEALKMCRHENDIKTLKDVRKLIDQKK